MEGRPSIAHICRGVQHRLLTTDYRLQTSDHVPLDYGLQDSPGLPPENLRHQGQEAPAIALPALEHLDATVNSGALFRRQLFDHVHDSVEPRLADRKSTRLNSSHLGIS